MAGGYLGPGHGGLWGRSSEAVGTEMTREAIAKAFKREREAAGFSQSSVAECLGIPRTSVSHIENGRRGVSADNLIRLAKLVGKSIDDILGINPEGSAMHVMISMDGGRVWSGPVSKAPNGIHSTLKEAIGRIRK